MPIIQSAKKKLRKDKKRKIHNSKIEKKFKTVMSEIRKGKTKTKSAELIKKAYSSLDRAVKSKIIHKNKAARLKSSLAKLFAKK